MMRSSILLGMGLTCALGGALAGNAVGSTPVTDRSTIEMFYQLHQTAYADRQEQRVPPNHYPLVTRNGVVPVAQLSERGLFSQARYRSYDIAADYASGEAEPGFVDSYDVEAAHQSQALAQEQSGAQPLSLAAGPAQVAGHAKIIDVQATLAMR